MVNQRFELGWAGDIAPVKHNAGETLVAKRFTDFLDLALASGSAFKAEDENWLGLSPDGADCCHAGEQRQHYRRACRGGSR